MTEGITTMYCLHDDCTNRNQHTHTATTDPAYALLVDPNVFSTPDPDVYDEHCYICTDPEFAQMGMSLCRSCLICLREGRGAGHIPADDTECTACGAEDERYQEALAELDARKAAETGRTTP